MSTTDDAGAPRREQPASHRWVGIVAIVAFIAIGVFPYLASALVVPVVPLVILMFCWGIGLTVTIRLARRRPLWSPATVPAAILFWWAYLTIGEAALGWVG